MKRGKSVIYVNYSPYENSGHILDYLNEKFEKIFLFSIAHHPLGRKEILNKVTYYREGIISEEIELYYMPVPSSMIWFFLPIRSTLNAIQILRQCFRIYFKFGSIDYFFSVNAFAVVVGMILKKIGLVKKTVFWVWDYYPMNYPSLSVKISRWMYWQFDKLATYTDRIVYLNDLLVNVRKEAGIIPKNLKYPISPIGMGEVLPVKKKRLNNIKIGFIGVLKKSQGIDMLIDTAPYVHTKFKNLIYEIIGSGPDETYFKKRAAKSPVKFNFHGYVTEEKFKQILSSCTIGIAPYTPEDSNVSRYGDPGKIKRYMEFNLPAIITDVFEFSKELASSKAGIVVKYGSEEELLRAVEKIINNYDFYVKNVLRLHKKFYYKVAYKHLFK